MERRLRSLMSSISLILDFQLRIISLFRNGICERIPVLVERYPWSQFTRRYGYGSFHSEIATGFHSVFSKVLHEPRRPSINIDLIVLNIKSPAYFSFFGSRVSTLMIKEATLQISPIKLRTIKKVTKYTVVNKPNTHSNLCVFMGAKWNDFSSNLSLHSISSSYSFNWFCGQPLQGNPQLAIP